MILVGCISPHTSSGEGAYSIKPVESSVGMRTGIVLYARQETVVGRAVFLAKLLVRFWLRLRLRNHLERVRPLLLGLFCGGTADPAAG